MGLQGEAGRRQAPQALRAPFELVDAVAGPAVEMVVVLLAGRLVPRRLAGELHLRERRPPPPSSSACGRRWRCPAPARCAGRPPAPRCGLKGRPASSMAADGATLLRISDLVIVRGEERTSRGAMELAGRSGSGSFVMIIRSQERDKATTPIIGSMTTTAPQQRIEADVKAAMKAGEKEKLSTLRMLLTEIKNERIRRGSRWTRPASSRWSASRSSSARSPSSQYRAGEPRGAGGQGGGGDQDARRLPAGAGGRGADPRRDRGARGRAGPLGSGGHGADHEGDARPLRLQRPTAPRSTGSPAKSWRRPPG